MRRVRRVGNSLPSRPRPRDLRRRPVDRRRCDCAVVGVPRRILQTGVEGGRRRVRLLDGHAVEEVEGRGQEGRAVRRGQQASHGSLQEPVRKATLVLDALRRRDPVGRAPAHRIGIRSCARADRGLHAPRAVPGVRRCAPAARVARGHDRRQEHLRSRRTRDRRCSRVLPHRRVERTRSHDRRARVQGSARAVAVHARRRPRLSDDEPRRRARSPVGKRNASGSRRRSAAVWSACCTCSTSRRSACTNATTNA